MVFYELLVEQGILKAEEVSYSSLYRFLKTLGLAGPKQRKEPERKRLAYEKVNAMWQADISSWSLHQDGQKKGADIPLRLSRRRVKVRFRRPVHPRRGSTTRAGKHPKKFVSGFKSYQHAVFATLDEGLMQERALYLAWTND
ncbi:MAG TPA: hypothetical protein GX510_09305 [Firmicutes bacterium]|nr:hypothetical protein [Candidatus Fermentithermobacillaceae bacterium]